MNMDLILSTLETSGKQHVVANNNQIISGISAGVEHANDETNMLLREVIENQESAS